MISPDTFPSTEMEISEKWDHSSANYTSKNWKRNNENLTMLTFGWNCKTGISLLKSYQMMQVLCHWYYCRHDVHKKRIFLLNSSLQSGWNVVSQLTLTYSLIAVVSFETKFCFRVSTFCTNCLRSLIISFQNANRKWSGTHFSFTLAWQTCQNDVLW